ncbi:hypothetical protein DFA_08169 [Cavenderia fasciculata]|uniref:Uncharacterized protein n=1 Tax=Cavenderia fasciculata TaxID=261658 RepID=F4Q5C5_CACFS|nr:uncharacterized protein DFA_08169 [Cavenderia fasciculata]EGG17184.1 hypothetical protein DFA_08169 [Cavenderia fasciculata]|eukprot:XP_004355668.1 hypothetical protein DFA_08169 [Cavenderia fasciculata]
MGYKQIKFIVNTYTHIVKVELQFESNLFAGQGDQTILIGGDNWEREGCGEFPPCSCEPGEGLSGMCLGLDYFVSRAVGDGCCDEERIEEDEGVDANMAPIFF